MKRLNNSIGRLRVIAILEGSSLLLLAFVAVPLKYGMNLPQLSSILGMIHGGLFLWFVLNTIRVAVEYEWKFNQTTWKVLLACLIPFGTFYIDRKILKKTYDLEINQQQTE